MTLDLKIDAQKFVQQVQTYNSDIEKQVQDGLDKAFEEIGKDGTIEKMIAEAVRKNVMDSFSRWIFQTNIRTNIEKQLTEKLSAKIDAYTDTLVNQIAEKMNLPE
jgi:hypothetical protein